MQGRKESRQKPGCGRKKKKKGQLVSELPHWAYECPRSSQMTLRYGQVYTVNEITDEYERQGQRKVV